VQNLKQEGQPERALLAVRPAEASVSSTR